MSRWVTVNKASDLTGLPTTFFDERTGASGHWPENKVWKWFEGRKLIDIDALDSYIDQKISPPSSRGRKRAKEPCPA